jgi:hypothetical protein
MERVGTMLGFKPGYLAREGGFKPPESPTLNVD